MLPARDDDDDDIYWLKLTKSLTLLEKTGMQLLVLSVLSLVITKVVLILA